MHEPSADRATQRVLVVEDDASVRALLSSVLTWSSWHVTACSTAASGLRAIRGDAFDVAIVDLGLPDSAGLGFLEHLTRDAPDMTVVVISGWGGDYVPREKLDALGVRAVLLKPFDLDQLKELMSGERVQRT